VTDNIVKLHEPKSPLLGPFTHYDIVVDGRRIPMLRGIKDGDKMTSLIVDGRFSTSVPNEHAYDVAWLLAQAIAIASGYPHLGAENKKCPFAPEIREMSVEDIT
jgi:hypothetical protein